MADRATYLNSDDQISAQVRRERAGTDVSGAITLVGGVAAFMLARRKINLSRAISSEVKSLGSAGQIYSRFSLTEVLKDKNLSTLSRWKGMARNWTEGLRAPIPTASEQLNIARLKLNRHGIKFSGMLPGVDDAQLTSWTRMKTFLHGPIAAIAPGAPITLPGKTLTSGEHGAISFGTNLYRMNRKGGVQDIISGVKSGIMGTSGERFEFLKTYGSKIKAYPDVEGFVRATRTPLKSDVILEHKRHMLEEIMIRRGVTPTNIEESVSRKALEALMTQYDAFAAREAADLGTEFVSAAKLFKQRSGALEDSYNTAINSIVRRELEKKSTHVAYKMHKVGVGLGIAPEFAPFESGGPHGLVRNVMESLEMNMRDPFTRRPYPIRGPRYIGEDVSMSGFWREGIKGGFYLHGAGNEIGRTIASEIEGTFFKQLENTFGVGITTRHSAITQLVSNLVGAKEGSTGDYFIRRYLGGIGRVAVLGYGAYTTFKVIDFLARQTTGWGVTDVAGKMYTSGREFQQRVIDQLGIVDQSKKLEKAFPGIISSPAVKFALASAPYWMAIQGGKKFGKKGAMLGLALGIATALTTWGDITQSPEELHRIYTGEQDIPVRKGRWWMFGKTPFEGGKIQYYRPHWYPLMRSRYKYQGQLWDSEAEELSTRGPLAPLLSPILTGKFWDQYSWEKKHYYDRPYPMTGELFEPTMPFSWLLNPTIGSILKPMRVMHPEYMGASQGEGGTSKTIVPGAGGAMGVGDIASSQFLPTTDTGSMGWLAGEAAYTFTEQMGLRGFLYNTLAEDITGRKDFLPQGPVVQTARRATGYERGYWDLNLGDPFGFTEFFRRILPHRRRGIEEYNPIQNTMPGWLPGEDYYINFKTGDPYTKVEMGEARLPGAGYESLHRLHSGIPGTYDAVDRFLILSDIAPYSNEYKEYSYLAMSMVKKDSYWDRVVKDHILQRTKVQEEYEFLDLEPPEDVTGIMRPLSSIYRKAVATLGAGGLGGALDPILGNLLFKSPIPFVMSPVSKFFPYRTAEQTYKDFRLHGSEFTSWGNPLRDFVIPSINRTVDAAMSPFGKTFIPPSETERREYEEYFDRLQYVKFKKLESMARDQGNAEMASKFGKMAKKTMTGINPTGNPMKMMGALPKRERAFVGAFSEAEGSERDRILNMVSKQMGEVYKAHWEMKDSGATSGGFSDNVRNAESIDFFKSHTLPGNNWIGWHPEVDLKDVQLKVTRNEGMDIHKFDLWESQERSMQRRPYVPTLESIHAKTDNIEDLKRDLQRQLSTNGYTNSRIYVTQTPASQNRATMRVKIRKNKSRQESQHMEELINA